MRPPYHYLALYLLEAGGRDGEVGGSMVLSIL
jgi:hypothetical protein